MSRLKNISLIEVLVAFALLCIMLVILWPATSTSDWFRASLPTDVSGLRVLIAEKEARVQTLEEALGQQWMEFDTLTDLAEQQRNRWQSTTTQDSVGHQLHWINSTRRKLEFERGELARVQQALREIQ